LREIKNAYKMLIRKPERKRQLWSMASKDNSKIDLVKTK
jgi:hypothetical protein